MVAYNSTIPHSLFRYSLNNLIRSEPNEHLAGVLAFEETDEGRGRILDAVPDRLLPLELARFRPRAHLTQEFRRHVHIVGDDKAFDGEPERNDGDEIRRP